MSIEQLANDLIATAVKQQLTDLYFLPKEDYYLVQSRCNHVFLANQTLSFSEGEQLISYFKYHAGMDIGERRRPQLGAYYASLSELNYFLRFSTVADFRNQETLVIRLLYQIELVTTANQQLEEATPRLPQQFSIIAQKVLQQRGLFIFAGPTGSGKTTTMYQLARLLAHSEKQVMTIEDPVEIYEPDFLQLQINPTAEIFYQDLIKLGLRHRPDIFIIGEIRDVQTAQLAVNAALSGHLVLTTLHARNVYGVLERLRSLGVEQTSLEQCLNGIIYQRLLPVATQPPLWPLYDYVFSDTLEAFWQLPLTEQLHQGKHPTKSWLSALATLKNEELITADVYQKFKEG